MLDPAEQLRLRARLLSASRRAFGTPGAVAAPPVSSQQIVRQQLLTRGATVATAMVTAMVATHWRSAARRAAMLGGDDSGSLGFRA